MHCSGVVSSLVLLAVQALAQAVHPSAPPKNVSQHAQDILSSGSGSACDQACAHIALKLPADHIHFSPDEINYIWSGQQGELVPACRVLPTSAEEVSVIYGIVKENGCHFAVKSGGHSQVPGASVAADGVTIDLAKMNKVEISKDLKSVYVGAGSIWLDVYNAVEAENLLVVGGRVADVGVGGLLTGGGISFLSNKHGWGCDNIISFEVVLADGTIATVDQEQHPELYRALKGAGFSNFGIITSFTLEAIVPANPKGFWVGYSLFDTGKIPTLLDEQHQLLSGKLDSDPDAAFIHAFGYDQAHSAELVLTMHFHGAHKTADTYPKIFDYTSKMETLMPPSPNIMPYSNITTMIYDQNPRPGKRSQYFCFSYEPSRELDEKLVNFYFNDMVPKVKHLTGLFSTLVMQPIYSNQRRTKRGGNALGLDDQPKMLNLVLLPWTWDLAEDDAFVYSKLEELVHTGETWAKELGVYHPYIYVNYAGQSQDVWRSYGEKNLKSLKHLQRQYDPEGIYTKGGLAGGGFRMNAKDELLGEDTPNSGLEKEIKDEL